METTLTKHERNLGAAIHASVFSKFFIPFGNFIIPLVLWTVNKQRSQFIDHNGKQALNFQISMLLYSIVSGIITIPFVVGFFPEMFDFGFFGFDRFNDFNTFDMKFGDNFPFGTWLLPIGLVGLFQVVLFMVNLVYTILATLRANEGQVFEYPLTIKFIR